MIGQTGRRMSEFSVFNKSVRGASHVASGKPCQDYSVSYDEDGIQILVVCDGHGGETYCRSDKGSRIAAEITLDCLKHFARTTSEKKFIGKSFSITAKPQKNPFVDADGRKLRFEELNETQKQYAMQAKAYLEAEGKCVEQQTAIKELIEIIYNEWISQINKDKNSAPFNKTELVALNNHPVEKAYGCTLLAFLQTPEFWLAFQIGDGSIFICDKNLSLRKPVPEDCTCFLNYTTSLCDTNPTAEFRYAFNGMDDMPAAVFVCSDGVEGCLRTKENVQDIFEQIIGLSLEGDNIEKELNEFLPLINQSGSRDDISVAGIININGFDRQEFKRMLGIKKKERDMRGEYKKRKDEIESIDSRVYNLKIKLEKQKDIHFMKKSELDELEKEVVEKKRNVIEIETTIATIKQKIEEQKALLEAKKADFIEWEIIVKNELSELESEENYTENLGENPMNYTNW